MRTCGRCCRDEGVCCRSRCAGTAVRRVQVRACVRGTRTTLQTPHPQKFDVHHSLTGSSGHFASVQTPHLACKSYRELRNRPGTPCLDDRSTRRTSSPQTAAASTRPQNDPWDTPRPSISPASYSRLALKYGERCIACPGQRNSRDPASSRFPRSRRHVYASGEFYELHLSGTAAADIDRPPRRRASSSASASWRRRVG